MKKWNKVLSAFLCCTLAVAAMAGCQPKDNYTYYEYDAQHQSSDKMLRFYSSDAGLDAFLNDYRERHMRDTEDRIHTHPVGAGSTAWKEWESMIGSWWDASSANGTMSSFYATKEWVTDWLLPPRQDRQGYIWADEGNDISSWGMGWAFPDYQNGGIGWLFDTDDESEGWYLGNASNASLTVENSNLIVDTAGATEQIELYSPLFERSTLVAPFLRMNFGFTGTGSYDIDDLFVYYTTDKSAQWSEDKKVSFSELCTTGFEIGAGNVSQQGFFFPMYLQEQWGAESRTRVTQLKIVLAAEEGTSFEGRLNFDYICTDFDDRQPLNLCNYIIAAKNVCEFAQDDDLLARLLPNARRAMNFLLSQLKGAGGLIDTEYFVGHGNDGLKGIGTGLGNGYWDVLAFPQVNLYCNISFYNALNAMSYLENMAQYYEIESDPVTTLGADMKSVVTYAETGSSLNELAQNCREKMQKVFWNEKTGRYHAGKRDFYDTVQDHGYLMFNEQVIASGIATKEQTDSILSWINGERKVAGDASTGEDIYYYEFAPRFNTAEIGADFYWLYSATFDGNVQNGGTALHLAYYDLVAQAAGDKNVSFARLKTIQAWYEKVKAAGGTGWDFYHKYYDNYTDIGIQGGPSGGTIGVDYEFLEAALLFAAVPDAYFGMDTSYDDTLVFQPSLPDAMDFWKMENLTFSGYYYDVSVGQFFVQISGVNEYREGQGSRNAKLEIRMPKPAFQFKVYLNNAETANYRLEDDQIVIETKFGNVKAEIKKI